MACNIIARESRISAAARLEEGAERTLLPYDRRALPRDLFFSLPTLDFAVWIHARVRLALSATDSPSPAVKDALEYLRVAAVDALADAIIAAAAGDKVLETAAAVNLEAPMSVHDTDDLAAAIHASMGNPDCSADAPPSDSGSDRKRSREIDAHGAALPPPPTLEERGFSSVARRPPGFGDAAIDAVVLGTRVGAGAGSGVESSRPRALPLLWALSCDAAGLSREDPTVGTFDRDAAQSDLAASGALLEEVCSAVSLRSPGALERAADGVAWALLAALVRGAAPLRASSVLLALLRAPAAARVVALGDAWGRGGGGPSWLGDAGATLRSEASAAGFPSPSSQSTGPPVSPNTARVARLSRVTLLGKILSSSSGDVLRFDPLKYDWPIARAAALADSSAAIEAGSALVTAAARGAGVGASALDWFVDLFDCASPRTREAYDQLSVPPAGLVVNAAFTVLRLTEPISVGENVRGAAPDPADLLARVDASAWALSGCTAGALRTDDEPLLTQGTGLSTTPPSAASSGRPSFITRVFFLAFDAIRVGVIPAIHTVRSTSRVAASMSEADGRFAIAEKRAARASMGDARAAASVFRFAALATEWCARATRSHTPPALSPPLSSLSLAGEVAMWACSRSSARPSLEYMPHVRTGLRGRGGTKGDAVRSLLVSSLSDVLALPRARAVRSPHARAALADALAMLTVAPLTRGGNSSDDEATESTRTRLLGGAIEGVVGADGAGGVDGGAGEADGADAPAALSALASGAVLSPAIADGRPPTLALALTRAFIDADATGDAAALGHRELSARALCALWNDADNAIDVDDATLEVIAEGCGSAGDPLADTDSETEGAAAAKSSSEGIAHADGIAWVDFSHALVSHASAVLGGALLTVKELAAKEREGGGGRGGGGAGGGSGTGGAAGAGGAAASLRAVRARVRAQLLSAHPLLPLTCAVARRAPAALLDDIVAARVGAMLLQLAFGLSGPTSGALFRVSSPGALCFAPRALLCESTRALLLLHAASETVRGVTPWPDTLAAQEIGSPAAWEALAVRVDSLGVASGRAVRALAAAVAHAAMRASVNARFDGEAPRALTCPISMTVFKRPVRTPNGRAYERASILQHLLSDGRDPFSRAPLDIADLHDDEALRKEARKWVRDQREKRRTAVAAEAVAPLL